MNDVVERGIEGIWIPLKVIRFQKWLWVERESRTA